MISATLLTPTGRGAVAVVRIAGALDLMSADPPLLTMVRGTPPGELPLGRIFLGRWGTPGEDVVVCRVAEDELEVCCHGGSAASVRILEDVNRRGGGEGASEVAYQGASGVDRECLEALCRATTLRTADILLQQQSGILRRSFEQLALAMTDMKAAEKHIDELLRWGDFGIHLTHPWQVVLCGRPNVGKSSLTNALVGYSRSIVFDQPGTTRDVVTAETALEGWPIEFSDTAGLREADDELERAGVERAEQRIASSDLQVVVLDGSTPLNDDDWRIVNNWPNAIVVRNKADLPLAWGGDAPHALPVSAISGAGVNELANEIVRRLVPDVPAPMTPVPITPRQVALLRRIRTLLIAGADGDAVQRHVAKLIEG